MIVRAILLAVALLAAPVAGQSPVAQPGPLCIVGGGGTPDLAFQRILALAGGPKAKVVVLPQASAVEDAGESTAKAFRDLGAGEAMVLRELRGEPARLALQQATLVWMTGGQQTRLMAALREADLITSLRARHAEGLAFGGTSAGAAVMSLYMIAGPAEGADRTGREPPPPISEGLGLLRNVIVDQHFLARSRLTRLMQALAAHPGQCGLGIDERTAVFVFHDRLEVLGQGQAVFITPIADPDAGPNEPRFDLRFLAPGRVLPRSGLF